MPLPRSAAKACDALLTLCLAGWLGSAIFFVAAVAPAIFEFADRPGEAGAAISRILTVLHIGGACSFSLAALLAWARRRGAWLLFGPLVLAALCLFSHFGVSRPMAELRERPPEIRTAADQQAQRRLHQVSVLVFCAVGLGSVVLLYHAGSGINGPISQRSTRLIS